MQLPETRSRAARRRVLAVTLGVLVMLGAGTAPTAAVEPIDLRDPDPTPRASAPPAPRDRPAPGSSPARTPRIPTAPTRPTPTARPTPTPTPTPTGLDVSWPQCGERLPEAFAFAIVGVNGGRVYRPNPCLGEGDDPSQLEWAGRQAQLYANTGNPGPELSSYWPHGQTTPRRCDTPEAPGADTVDCAYVYGWNAAEDSYRTALEAFVSLGWADRDADRLPGELIWWLDVETANSWRLDRRLNVAALQGAVDYLESVGAAEVGFYSTPLLWWQVTGGTDAFAEHPAWHAGARDLEDAQKRCDDDSFTGGELRMVQWIEDDLDVNFRCP